jgi:hypothetical protein
LDGVAARLLVGVGVRLRVRLRVAAGVPGGVRVDDGVLDVVGAGVCVAGGDAVTELVAPGDSVGVGVGGGGTGASTTPTYCIDVAPGLEMNTAPTPAAVAS